MTPHSDMDLVTLLGSVPPLLEHCETYKNRSLRALRLVSKEACRVALLCLRSFDLNINGAEHESHVIAARILHPVHLAELTIRMSLTGGYLNRHAGAKNG